MKTIILFALFFCFAGIEKVAADAQRIIDRQFESNYVDGIGTLSIIPLSDGGFYVEHNPNQCIEHEDGSLDCTLFGFEPCKSELGEVTDKSGVADRPSRLQMTSNIFLEIGGMPIPGEFRTISVYAVQIDGTGTVISRVMMNKIGTKPMKKYYQVTGVFGGGDGPELRACY